MGENKNPWLILFEESDEEEKLIIIWRVAHFATINSLNKYALHAMLKWLAAQTIEEDKHAANP